MNFFVFNCAIKKINNLEQIKILQPVHMKKKYNLNVQPNQIIKNKTFFCQKGLNSKVLKIKKKNKNVILLFVSLIFCVQIIKTYKTAFNFNFLIYLIFIFFFDRFLLNLFLHFVDVSTPKATRKFDLNFEKVCYFQI